MADQPTYKFLPEDKCLSESQLFDYIDGKLKTSDMHFIEKHIMSCGFCSDALEGLEKVKHRDKVAAFIPVGSIKKEEKEEPKVIPLNPNRKYYALAAGLVLILGITLFLKLSNSDDLSQSKMAEVTNKDSSVLVPKKESVEKTLTNVDSTAQGKATDTRTVYDKNVTRDVVSENKKLERVLGNEESPGFFSMEEQPAMDAAPSPKSPDQSVLADKYDDGEGADDFVNIVDAKVTDEQKAGGDDSKDKKAAKPAEKQALAEKAKAANRADTDQKDRDNQLVTVNKENANTTEDVPVILSTTSGTVSQAQGTSTSAPPASNTATQPNYTWSTGDNSGTVTVTDSTSVTVKTQRERELDLSYENANKLLAAGQAAASLTLYDEVLKNPAHPHYQDAQWKKSEALIQLKRIEEAKKLLNEIAGKPGKYKEQAKTKLKTL